MRVIETDNFGGDYPDEKFVGPEEMTEGEATKLCRQMNAGLGSNPWRWHRVVPDSYVLLKGFEP
jgi:hypothetical protein